MRRLSFSDWCDKYEERYSDEYQDHVSACWDDDVVPMELCEFLEDKYEESISEYEDRCYDEYKDERHFND